MSMRKTNAVITVLVLVFFLIHAIMGGFQLFGVIPGGKTLMKVITPIMEAFILAHLVIGCKLTVDSLRAVKKSGKGYFRENKLFWVRRISGFAVMLFIFVHAPVFAGKNDDGVYRLAAFEGVMLTAHILFVMSLALHIVSNANPMLLSFGVKSFKELGLDIALILSFVLIFTAIAFIIYYVRWNVI